MATESAQMKVDTQIITYEIPQNSSTPDLIP